MRLVILAIALYLIYTASAWVMLRSATNPRLSPIAWALALAAVCGHSDAIVHMMRTQGPVSIGLLEALSLLGWTLAVLACLLCIEKQNRVLGAILLACAAFGAAATGSGGTYAEENVPGWELTAHILLSMGAAALLFAAAVTALLLVFLDRRLRARRLAELPRELPPLDALERVMFRLIGAGFGMLTLALLTGFIFVTNLFEQLFDTKDRAVADRVGDLRYAVDRAHPLRLARPPRGALDVVRFRRARIGVFWLQVRPRNLARKTLGLNACHTHLSRFPSSASECC